MTNLLQQQSAPSRIATIKELGRSDLFFFLVFVLNRKDAFNQYILDRCREYQENPYGYLDLWARGHYKSTIITFAHIIFSLITQPEDSFVIFSHTSGIARAFLAQIKRELETNELLKSLYPEVFYEKPEKQSPLWSVNEGIIVKRNGNPKEASLESWGVVDNQPTSKHFNHLIYDDLVTLETVNTPEQITKALERFRMSLNLVAERHTLTMVGTFYAHNDPYTTLIKEGVVKARIHKAMLDPQDFATSVLLSPEALKKKRKEMGPAVFATQMLLDPSIQSGASFRKEWIKYFDGQKQSDWNYVLLVDPSGGKGKKSDYTAMFVVGLGRDKNFYVVHIIRDRLNLSQRTEAVFSLVEEYEPLGVWYEEYGLQADIEHIRAEQTRRNYRFPITPVGGNMPKKNRILRLQPDFESGRIYLPTRFNYTTVDGEVRDMVADFIDEEYLNYPAVDHDDALDCLARLYDIPLKFPHARRYGEVSETNSGVYIS